MSRYLAIICLIVLTSMPLLCLASELGTMTPIPWLERGKTEDERNIALQDTLKKAGVDITSIPSIVKALKHDDNRVRLAALTLIRQGKYQKAIEPLQAILCQEFSQHLGLTASSCVEICQVLVEIGDKGYLWQNVCKACLSSNDSIAQLRAADLLVQQQDTSGWAVVKQHLNDEFDPLVLEAANVAVKFNGLTYQSGNGMITIPVLDAFTDAFHTKNGLAQAYLIDAIAKIAVKDDTERLKALLPLVIRDYDRATLQRLIDRLNRATIEPPTPESKEIRVEKIE